MKAVHEVYSPAYAVTTGSQATCNSRPEVRAERERESEAGMGCCRIAGN
jgi:hypothetical protein